MTQEFSFTLSFDDFELSLLSDPSLDRSSESFGAKVSEFFVKQFEGFGGRARVIVNDATREVEVRWTKETRWKDPKETILDLLNRGELAKALPLIWTLVQQDPDDADNLYHLGVVFSELQQYSKATEVLERLVQVDPEHVHGLTALGVAEIGCGNLNIAEQWLHKAVKLQPNNRWALRNLGACLMKQDRFDEASTILRRCLAEAPTDIAAMVGLAEALDAMGKTDEAGDFYKAAIKTGGPEHIVDIAKQRRTKMAEAKLRSNAKFRPDALHYIKEALDCFDGMNANAIQGLGFEIASLGSQGLDINDPSTKYKLKALGGEFTGLHLVCMMYAAVQQFAPQQDVGIDLSAEYEAALRSRGDSLKE